MPHHRVIGGRSFGPRSSPESSGTNHPVIRHNTPEERRIQQHRCEKLKAHLLKFFISF